VRAQVVYRHGGPEEMVFVPAFPDPEPAPGEVRLRVRAASLNYHDVFTRGGMPGIKVPMPIIMGLDLAGEIERLGPGVEGWRLGERVLVDPTDWDDGTLMGETRNGGLAELCCVSAGQLIRLPGEVSFAEAAALPVAYGTAHRMMLSNGKVAAGEKVLVLGASGGVGTCCVLLAKLAGAEVIAATSSAAKAERLRAMGADRIIDYGREDFVQVIREAYGKPTRLRPTGGVDVVVNFTGGDTWVPSLRALRLGGRMLTCGATAGYEPKTDIRYIWTFELDIKGSNGWRREDLERLVELVRRRELLPEIDRVLPLEAAGEGMRLIEAREVMGKVVIEP
jgi:alcohol dehydrogenase